jgi:hypothetical protein
MMRDHCSHVRPITDGRLTADQEESKEQHCGASSEDADINFGVLIHANHEGEHDGRHGAAHYECHVKSGLAPSDMLK